MSFSQSATAAESRELSRRVRGDVVRVDSDLAVRQAWSPPMALDLDVELRWERGSDIPEEESELDVVQGDVILLASLNSPSSFAKTLPSSLGLFAAFTSPSAVLKVRGL